MFKRIGCVLSAFQMYFYGCVGVYLMVAISIERFLIFKNSTSVPRSSLSLKSSLLIVLTCILFGLLWPVLPLFGWSYYSLETSHMVRNIQYLNSFLMEYDYFISKKNIPNNNLFYLGEKFELLQLKQC